MSGKRPLLVPGVDGLFDSLVSVYVDKSDVRVGKAFHNDVLKVNDKIFAMLVRGQLVVKVPADQAAALTLTDEAAAFEPRDGRKMKEWVIGEPPRSPTDRRWERLVGDAYVYVASLPGFKRSRGMAR